MCAIILIAAAIVFWLVVPRIDRLGRRAFILAVIGALSIVLFWTGVPPAPLHTTTYDTSGGRVTSGLPPPRWITYGCRLVAAAARE